MHVIDAHSYRSDWLCAQAGPKAYRPKETPDSTMLRTPLEALAGGGSQQRCTLDPIAQQVWVVHLNDRQADSRPRMPSALGGHAFVGERGHQSH